MDRLVERVDKLKEEIAMYEAQLTAQLEETKAAKEQLMEAHMEIEVSNCQLVYRVYQGVKAEGSGCVYILQI